MNRNAGEKPHGSSAVLLHPLSLFNFLDQNIRRNDDDLRRSTRRFANRSFSGPLLPVVETPSGQVYNRVGEYFEGDKSQRLVGVSLTNRRKQKFVRRRGLRQRVFFVPQEKTARHINLRTMCSANRVYLSSTRIYTKFVCSGEKKNPIVVVACSVYTCIYIYVYTCARLKRIGLTRRAYAQYVPR